MARYVAVIHKERRSSYGVSFPDFPGCVSAGRTPEEAAEGAREALELHIKGLLEDGEQLPDPTPADAVVAEVSKGEHAYLLFVEADLPSRTVRINVTMDEGLLREIDRATRNRSAFLAQAAREKLDRATAR